MKKEFTIVAIIITILIFIIGAIYIFQLDRALNLMENRIHQNLVQQQANTEEKLDQDKKNSITEEEAIKVALTHAGVKQNETSFLRIKQDYDDGISIYEVDFNVGIIEYNYSIDTTTGKIIEFGIDN